MTKKIQIHNTPMAFQELSIRILNINYLLLNKKSQILAFF